MTIQAVMGDIKFAIGKPFEKWGVAIIQYFIKGRLPVQHGFGLLGPEASVIFFSLFMQLFHLPAGPSELHLLGAMPIYLLLGFVPALFGFALGLLFQGLAFAPTDLAHLSINSLSLMLPLIAVHMAFGKNLKTKDLSLKSLAKLDSAFYAGVTLMVGFWLLGEGVTSFATWAVFAASYAPIVLGEIAFTVGALQLVQKFGQNNLVAYCFGEMKAA